MVVQNRTKMASMIIIIIISSVKQFIPIDVGLQIELHTKTVIGDISLYGDGQLWALFHMKRGEKKYPILSLMLVLDAV